MPKVTLLRKKVRGKWSKTFYLNYGNRNIRSTGISDPELAEQLRAREEAKLVLSEHGMPVPGDNKRTLESHIKEYEAKLIAPGRNEEYVAQTCGMIRKIAKHAKWRSAMSIKAADVNDYAVGLREKFTSRTAHSHLTAINGFTKWLTEQGRLPADPLRGVKKPSPARESRRRFLLPDEWRAIRKTTLAEEKEHHGMEPAERITLYCLAVQSGLRQNEIRSLTHGNLFLSGPQPFVTCHGPNTKNGQDARQYIKPELAHELLALGSRGKVFPGLPARQYVAPMLRADLVAAARAAWLEESPDAAERARREETDFLLAVNHGGEHLDFHSLRHTTGAWLALAGCHPKVVQEVMRHSSIVLTMGAYGHLFPGQVAEAIAKLPDMLDG
jgi:integrase